MLFCVNYLPLLFPGAMGGVAVGSLFGGILLGCLFLYVLTVVKQRRLLEKLDSDLSDDT